MKKWKCTVCGYIYDEAQEDMPFASLPEDWTCPRCGAPLSAFRSETGEEKRSEADITVADKIVEQLAAYGVKRIYGIPGNSNLPLTDAIRRHPDVDLVLTRHEQSAAYMASAHAKLTGRIGVCMSIAGPGATNLITGVVDAATDRAPVLILMGQVPEIFLGSESLQEIAEVDIFKNFCHYTEMITNPGHALKIVNMAIKKAYYFSGPSALSLPTDVLAKPLSEKIWKPQEHLFDSDLIPGDSLEHAVSVIEKSKRPLLFAGWGARNSGADLLDLAEHIGAPVATTSRAKGVIPESHNLSLGVLVQIDIDATRVGKTFPVKAGIVGDVGKIIPLLRKKIAAREMDPEFRKLIDEAQNEYRRILEEDGRIRQKPIYPGAVIQALKRQAPQDAIICSDVGDHIYWFYKRFICEGQKTLLCANMAGMGFAVPAAIACQLEEPERRVIAIVGDGGFGMTGMEFTTAVKNNLPLTILLFNDGKLKNIKKEQLEYGYPEYRVQFPNPDFAAMASSAGGLGIRVTESDELDEAISQALISPLPALVEVLVDPDLFAAAVRGI